MTIEQKHREIAEEIRKIENSGMPESVRTVKLAELKGEQRGLDGQMDMAAAAEQRAAEMEEGMANVPLPGYSDTKEKRGNELIEFRSWLAQEKRDVSYSANVFAPVDWARSVITELENRVPIRQLARRIVLSNAEGVSLPKRTAAATAPVWNDTVAAETDLAMDSITIRPKKLPQFIKIDENITRVAPYIDQFIRAELVDSTARTLENAYLTGDGTNDTPAGVFNTAGISTAQDITVSTGLNIESFVKAVSELPSGYKPVWIMHPSVWADIQTLTDGSSKYIALGDIRNGEPQRFLGFPVYLSSYAPSVLTAGSYAAVLGDFSRGFVVADVESMEIVRHADSTLSAAGMVGFISKMWTSAAVVDESAFRRIKIG